MSRVGAGVGAGLGALAGGLAGLGWNYLFPSRSMSDMNAENVGALGAAVGAVVGAAIGAGSCEPAPKQVGTVSGVLPHLSHPGFP